MLSLLPTMAAMEATTVATDTMASDLLTLSPRQSPRRSPRRSPRLLLNTTSLFTDTTGTMASAPLMLSLLPSTSMPTLPMDTTMVEAYSTPQVCKKPPSTILRTASCNIVVGSFQQNCVLICSKASPSRLTKKPMPSNSCNSFANCNDKIFFRFSSPLPCLSVFDFKQNYWINLAHSAIPKEPSLKEFSVKHLKHSPSTYPTCKCRGSSGASLELTTQKL